MLAAGIGVAAVILILAFALGFSGNRNQQNPAILAENEKTAGENTAQTAEDAQMDAEKGKEEQGTEELLTLSSGEELGEQIVFYDPQNSVSTSNGENLFTLFCLPDGTVTARGSNSDGQCDVENWQNVAAVSAGVNCSMGLKTDGTVLFAGSELSGFGAVRQWKDITAISNGYFYVVGLKKDKTVEIAGNREQLPEVLQEVESWTNIRAVTSYYGVVIGLQEDGKLLLAGKAEGMQYPEIKDWKDVKTLIVNGAFLFGICEDGSVKYSALRPDAVNYEESIKNIGQVRQISAGHPSPSVGIRGDGSVFSTEEISNGMEEFYNWKNVVAVVNTAANYGVGVLYGMQEDGTILSCMANAGNAEPEEFKNLDWIQVAGGRSNDLIGCTKDGKILAYGSGADASCLNFGEEFYSLGNNLKQVSDFVALRKDGTVIDLGRGGYQLPLSNVSQIITMWDAYSNNQHGACYAVLKNDGSVQIHEEGTHLPDYDWSFQEIKKAEEWTGMKQILSNGGTVFYGLKEDGTVWDVRNGQISYGEKITQIALGAENALLGLSEDGRIIPIIMSAEEVGAGIQQAENWKDITQFAVGESHIVGLHSDGTVAAAGSNYAGQCEAEDWTDIVSLAAGRTCTFGITKDGELKMAGTLY